MAEISFKEKHTTFTNPETGGDSDVVQRAHGVLRRRESATKRYEIIKISDSWKPEYETMRKIEVLDLIDGEGTHIDPDFDYENSTNFIQRPTPNSQLAIAMDIEAIRLPTRLFARKGRKELQIIAKELFGNSHFDEINEINKWKLTGAVLGASYVNSVLLSGIVALKPDLKGTPEIVEMLALAYLVPSIIIWLIDLAIAVPMLTFAPELISKIQASRPGQKPGSQDARELLEEMADILALASDVRTLAPENEKKVLLEALILKSKELKQKMMAMEALLEEQSGSAIKGKQIAISGVTQARVEGTIVEKD